MHSKAAYWVLQNKMERVWSCENHKRTNYSYMKYIRRKQDIRLKKTKIKSELNKSEIRSLDLASEKGASSWLNAMTLKWSHFHLTKIVVPADNALYYGWDPVKMPSLCACNKNFTVAHALNCPKGGCTHMRLNELCISFANLLNDICHDVEIKPHLQPLEGGNFCT